MKSLQILVHYQAESSTKGGFMGFMGQRLGLLTFLAVMGFALGACQRGNQIENGEDLVSASQQVLSAHQVVDAEGRPVVGADVLIGLAPGNPFRGNQLKTNAQGQFSVPAGWNRPQPITIEAQGFIKATFDRVPARPRAYVIVRQELDQPITVRGEARNFPGIQRNGWVDFALVLPTFRKSDLLGFELSQVISPETDRITIVGNNIDIPSNISLPRQRETYVIPITLDKPQFRTEVRRTGENEFVATHAQFPFRETVDHIRGGGSIFDIIKDFRFIGAGLESTNVTQQNSRLNISVNQMRFQDTMTVRGPSIANDQMMFTLGLVNREGRYFPTDLKFLESNQAIQLRTVQGQGEVFKAALLTNKADGVVSQETIESIFQEELDPPQLLKKVIEASTETSNLQQMSIALQRGNDDSAFQFLPLVEAPFVRGTGALLRPPASRPGITPLSTRLILSEVEKLKSGEIESERRTRLWEVSAPGWVTTIELPNHELVKKPNRVYRWEVIFLAHSGQATSTDDIEAATHISRNAVNF